MLGNIMLTYQFWEIEQDGGGKETAGGVGTTGCGFASKPPREKERVSVRKVSTRCN